MASVASVDGTAIDYDIAGSGPVIVFVAGVFNLRDTLAPLAAELNADHTVLTYDRRGRGEAPARDRPRRTSTRVRTGFLQR